MWRSTLFCRRSLRVAAAFAAFLSFTPLSLTSVGAANGTSNVSIVVHSRPMIAFPKATHVPGLGVGIVEVHNQAGPNDVSIQVYVTSRDPCRELIPGRLVLVTSGPDEKLFTPDNEMQLISVPIADVTLGDQHSARFEYTFPAMKTDESRALIVPGIATCASSGRHDIEVVATVIKTTAPNPNVTGSRYVDKYPLWSMDLDVGGVPDFGGRIMPTDLNNNMYPGLPFGIEFTIIAGVEAPNGCTIPNMSELASDGVPIGTLIEDYDLQIICVPKLIGCATIRSDRPSIFGIEPEAPVLTAGIQRVFGAPGQGPKLWCASSAIPAGTYVSKKLECIIEYLPNPFVDKNGIRVGGFGGYTDHAQAHDRELSPVPFSENPYHLEGNDDDRPQTVATPVTFGFLAAIIFR
jgi:hypothetical protein